MFGLNEMNLQSTTSEKNYRGMSRWNFKCLHKLNDINVASPVINHKRDEMFS